MSAADVTRRRPLCAQALAVASTEYISLARRCGADVAEAEPGAIEGEAAVGSSSFRDAEAEAEAEAEAAALSPERPAAPTAAEGGRSDAACLVSPEVARSCVPRPAAL